jgi:hypothetical protein
MGGDIIYMNIFDVSETTVQILENVSLEVWGVDNTKYIMSIQNVLKKLLSSTTRIFFKSKAWRAIMAYVLDMDVKCKEM